MGEHPRDLSRLLSMVLLFIRCVDRLLAALIGFWLFCGPLALPPIVYHVVFAVIDRNNTVLFVDFGVE